MAGHIKQAGYKLGSQQKISVTTSEDHREFNGINVECHNAGTEVIYVSDKTGVSSDNYELGIGERMTVTGLVYFVGAGNTTLKTITLI